MNIERKKSTESKKLATDIEHSMLRRTMRNIGLVCGLTTLFLAGQLYIQEAGTIPYDFYDTSGHSDTSEPTAQSATLDQPILMTSTSESMFYTKLNIDLNKTLPLSHKFNYHQVYSGKMKDDTTWVQLTHLRHLFFSLINPNR